MLSVTVAAWTVRLVSKTALSMVREEVRLDCHYAGTGAHTHDDDCYDADGSLVCPLEERASHVHEPGCYDASGNIVCGQDEVTEGHVHGPGCFTTVRVATSDAPAPAMIGPDGSLRFDGLIADNDGTTLMEVAVKGDPTWVSGQDEATWQVRVWNSGGLELPASGGKGVSAFGSLGVALLVLGALAMIARNGRRAA